LIRLLNKKEIDPLKWNACITNSANPLFYFLFEVMDIASDEKWEALIDEDYQTVFPLHYNYKFGIKYYYTPFWIQKTGWINPEPKHYNPKNFIKAGYIDLFTQNLSSSELKNRNNWILHLNSTLNYSSNTLRNIKKSKLADVQILQVNPNAKDFTEYFKKNKCKDLSNLNKPAYNRLERIIDFLITQNRIVEFQAIKKGEILSRGLFICFNDTYTYFKGCSSLNAKNSGAGHALIDFAINYAQNNHFNYVDFYGGQEAGMAQFYSGFGAKPSFYRNYLKNNLPKPLRWLKNN